MANCCFTFQPPVAPAENAAGFASSTAEAVGVAADDAAVGGGGVAMVGVAGWLDGRLV